MMKINRDFRDLGDPIRSKEDKSFFLNQHKNIKLYSTRIHSKTKVDTSDMYIESNIRILF